MDIRQEPWARHGAKLNLHISAMFSNLQVVIETLTSLQIDTSQPVELVQSPRAQLLKRNIWKSFNFSLMHNRNSEIMKFLEFFHERQGAGGLFNGSCPSQSTSTRHNRSELEPIELHFLFNQLKQQKQSPHSDSTRSFCLKIFFLFFSFEVWHFFGIFSCSEHNLR